MGKANTDSRWVVCQIGAREHYAIARGLHARGMLAQLITDVWVRPSSLLTKLPLPSMKRIRGRYHSDLCGLSPLSPTLRSAAREVQEKLRHRRKRNPWNSRIDRNRWFGNYCSRKLRKLAATAESPLTVFSYSYAALPIFRVARELGISTVLGQIDAGIQHQRRVEEAYASQPEWGTPHSPPDQYWSDWKEECTLADRIVVNSGYARKELLSVGVCEPSKLEIIPVAYDDSDLPRIERTCCKFSAKCPMRVMIIGRATLEKGMSIVLQAARMVHDLPITFEIIGNPHLVPLSLRDEKNLIWHGNVPRSDVHDYYNRASILAFPTLSDGFGLTQLEAQGHRVPVIASANCGDVVTTGVNGFRLKHNTADELAEVLRMCCGEPEILKQWSANSGVTDRYSPRQVIARLVDPS